MATGNFSVTVSPNPVSTGGTYHVEAHGFHKDGTAIVDTTGSDYFNRSEYHVDSDGILSYDASVPPNVTEFGLTFQQMQGPNLHTVGAVVVQVQ